MIKKRKILSLVTAAVLCFSMSSAAFADNIDGQGAIGRDNGGSAKIVVVTVPSNFYWYADDNTVNSTGTYDIESGDYDIINNSEQPNLKVKFDNYAATASATNAFSTVLESDITLNLTGDLATGGLGQDLFNWASAVTPTSPYGTYSTVLYGQNHMNGTPGLSDTDTWTFGFDGTYNQTSLPSTGELADYTITLTFIVDSLT
ncbi:MAG: hypothetical protein ACRC3H_08375 [Lachnospiraceae bacterium]